MSRIELVTQRSKEKLNEPELREKTLDKLHHLVDEDLEESNKHYEEKASPEVETLIKEKERSPSPEVDYDGFEVPAGKIPIDGNFSSSEIKELVELAKEDGWLDKNVEVDVVGCNTLGCKVIVSEKSEEKKEEGEKKEGEEKSEGKGEKESKKKD